MLTASEYTVRRSLLIKMPLVNPITVVFASKHSERIAVVLGLFYPTHLQSSDHTITELSFITCSIFTLIGILGKVDSRMYSILKEGASV